MSALRVRITGHSPSGRVVIEPVVRNGEDIGVEIFAAGARSALLAEALDIEVVIEQQDEQAPSVESS